ncbi:MAG: hypothetical protein QOF58_4604 [Pseudonocardiales bacterium]|nr:hypothetical protein [Pseudonocardiales bacterium]
MSASVRPRIAIVAGTPQLLAAATALGVDAVFVHAGNEPAAAGHAVAVSDVDSETVFSVLAPLHDIQPFDRVLSLTEAGLLPAAEVAHRLGVEGNPLHTVRLLQDKRRMRELLAANELSPVLARPVSSGADLAGFCRDVGGPVILKPAAGTASRAVFLVEAEQDAATVWEEFVVAGGVDPIAEEFLDGQELSVEAFSHDGEHVVIALTDKLLGPNFVELGHTVPSALPAVRQEEIKSLVLGFLDAVGLSEGPSHTEVKLTSRGPRVIESHNRIGGDKIRELVRRAYGHDLVQLTVGCPLGLTPPPEPAPARRGAAIRFLTPASGTVARIVLPLDTEGCVIDLAVGTGDVIGEVRSSGDRSGYVLAEGVDAEDATGRGERVRDAITVETVPAGRD